MLIYWFWNSNIVFCGIKIFIFRFTHSFLRSYFSHVLIRSFSPRSTKVFILRFYEDEWPQIFCFRIRTSWAFGSRKELSFSNKHLYVAIITTSSLGVDVKLFRLSYIKIYHFIKINHYFLWALRKSCVRNTTIIF